MNIRFLRLLLLLGWTSSLPLSANTAAEPAGRGGNWPERHQTYLELSAAGGVDVMFLGDSITDRWRNETEGKTIWDAELAPLGAANYGIGGDRTQHVLWRIQNGELDGISPQVVVLMIGTNNTGLEKDRLTPRNTPEQTADGVARIVATLREKLPTARVLLLAVFPRGESPEHPQRLQVAEINRRIASLHDGKQVFYYDFGERFLQPDGTISREIMPDFLHPGPAGYRIWMDAIREPLHALLHGKTIDWSKFAQ